MKIKSVSEYPERGVWKNPRIYIHPEVAMMAALEIRRHTGGYLKYSEPPSIKPAHGPFTCEVAINNLVARGWADALLNERGWVVGWQLAEVSAEERRRQLRSLGADMEFLTWQWLILAFAAYRGDHTGPGFSWRALTGNIEFRDALLRQEVLKLEVDGYLMFDDERAMGYPNAWRITAAGRDKLVDRYPDIYFDAREVH